ncbi:secretin N-terminal domain-containing protein [Stutzerimonas tarimensis]|uniref:Secretin N-terminal domain-containing protein n=1 Tax=Stutzerimonas tarimensis TaxID=1507735 RepID=A0ABV7T0S6_9GAMM
MRIRATLGALLFSCTFTVAAATEVISLQHRMAEEMLPVAISVVGDQGRVSSHGSQLIVNAPESVIAQLRQVLEQLDTRPRRLLISVENQDTMAGSASGHAISGRARAGDVNIHSGDGRNQVRIIRHSTASREGGIGQVQATEGYPALIQVGQSIPLDSTSVDPYGQPYRNTQYRDVMSGFYATAQVQGDQVQVTLSSQRDRVSHNQPGVIDMQQTETRVRGRVGDWIDVGGIDQSGRSDRRDVLSSHATTGRQDYRLRLKVEVLD